MVVMMTPYACMCGVGDGGCRYLLDAQFMDDTAKFFSGILSATSTMLQMEIPHINAMSKMDLVHPAQRKHLEVVTYLCSGRPVWSGH